MTSHDIEGELVTHRTIHVENRYLEFHKNDVIGFNDKKMFVVKANGKFHLRLAMPQKHFKTGEIFFIVSARKAHGILYRPPHPSMTKDDIEGATYAYDDGTHWWFAHCSPGEQIDFAAEARTFALNQFKLKIHMAQIKLIEAENDAAKTQAKNKLTGMLEFAELVGNDVYTTITQETLGYFHRDPHKDHKRDLTIKSIKTILDKWKKDGLTNTNIATKRSLILSDIGLIKSRLESTHSIEWRHVREQRLEAAKKAEKTTVSSE